MQEYDTIRPYRDDEVPEVVARLIRDPELRYAAAALTTPRLTRRLPALACRLAGSMLKLNARRFRSVADVQRFLERYMQRIVEETISELGVSGFDRLEEGRAYLFVSNHRDIMMDSALLNYALYHAGYRTCRVAVGDNLLSQPYVADLMRLNKSFVVERSVTGRRAVYNALNRTSGFIRQSLEEGHSVWIAQREGRAKDGYDRTEPALLKMLALAYRDEIEGFGEFLERVALVPVAISYEIDPCDRMKAHELAVRARSGSYHKAADEDLRSIVTGMTGFKGRVNLHLAPRLSGEFADADALAAALDRAIVGGLKIYPTHRAAARSVGVMQVPTEPGAAEDWLPDVRAAFEERLRDCPEAEREHLLNGYANVVRNRLELGIGEPRGEG